MIWGFDIQRGADSRDSAAFATCADSRPNLGIEASLRRSRYPFSANPIKGYLLGLFCHPGTNRTRCRILRGIQRAPRRSTRMRSRRDGHGARVSADCGLAPIARVPQCIPAALRPHH